MLVGKGLNCVHCSDGLCRFLSCVRHDYFRRILCNLIGTWVDDGEYPNDQAALKEIVEGVCYKNAERYFNF